MTERLLTSLRTVEEYADAFVTHWMEDDGNDAEDKARCNQVEDEIAGAATTIKQAIEAARAMLATLKHTAAWIEKTTPATAFAPRDMIRCAIRDAEAAGIQADAPQTFATVKDACAHVVASLT